MLKSTLQLSVRANKLQGHMILPALLDPGAQTMLSGMGLCLYLGFPGLHVGSNIRQTLIGVSSSSSRFMSYQFGILEERKPFPHSISSNPFMDILPLNGSFFCPVSTPESLM